MKRWLANIIIRILNSADKDKKAVFYRLLKNDESKQRYNDYLKKYTIDETFGFNGLNITLYGDGEIICGKNSYIGDYSTIQAKPGCKVKIGENTSISHNVRIYTGTKKTQQNMNHSGSKEIVTGDIHIGDGVWIGANVFITEGITVGNNVVVGANSVVTKDLEENSIYAGVPATLINKKKID